MSIHPLHKCALCGKEGDPQEMTWAKDGSREGVWAHDTCFLSVLDKGKAHAACIDKLVTCHREFKEQGQCADGAPCVACEGVRELADGTREPAQMLPDTLLYWARPDEPLPITCPLLCGPPHNSMRMGKNRKSLYCTTCGWTLALSQK